MKKIGITLFLLVLLWNPTSIQAVSIDSSSITGVEQQAIGKEFTLDFRINLADMDMYTYDTTGVIIVQYEILFNDDVFILTEIEGMSGWDNKVYKENGRYFVYSEVGANIANHCIDNLAFCGNVLQTRLKFFVKDTTFPTSDIKMGEIQLAIIQLKEDYNYTNDDIGVIMSKSNEVKTIKIKEKNGGTTVTEHQSIIESTKPKSNIENEINHGLAQTQKKNENSDLKTLSVENAEIPFEKTKKNYYITVEEGINQIKVEALAEDSKAKVNIIGAEDLRANNNKVTIEVTAENGNKNTYMINVKQKKKMIDEESEEESEKNKMWKLENKHYIIGGIIFILLLLLIIISKLKDKKLDKSLKEL